MINGLVALLMVVHWVVFVALTVLTLTGDATLFLIWIGAAIETAVVIWAGFWYLERFVKFG